MAIIHFPDFIKLLDEVNDLKEKLSDAVYEKDELRYVICPNIEMEYMMLLGSLEYRLYSTECAYLRIKRKCELLQAKINRQETISMTAINECLDREFEKYQEYLESKMQQMNDAFERKKGDFLSNEDTAELKSLYRKIVKQLHPDINPENSSAQRRLFENAVEAYKKGDLIGLRIVDQMISTPEIKFEEPNVMQALYREREKLQQLVSQITNEIDEIKDAFPYNVKSIIEDFSVVEDRKAELTDAIKGYEDLIDKYNARIEEMLGE